MQSCSRPPPTPTQTSHSLGPFRKQQFFWSLVDKYLWVKTKSDLQLAILKLLWLDSVISGNAISKSIKVYIIHDYNSMRRPRECAIFFDHGGTFNKSMQSVFYYDFSSYHFSNLWYTNRYIISNEYFYIQILL